MAKHPPAGSYPPCERDECPPTVTVTTLTDEVLEACCEPEVVLCPGQRGIQHSLHLKLGLRGHHQCMATSPRLWQTVHGFS
jgi:hypothetical protein